MSDTILNSLESSSLQRSVNQISSTDPFEYSLGESSFPVSVEVVKVAPESAVKTDGDQVVSVRLPSAGFLVDGAIVLKNDVEIPDPAPATSSNGPGLYFYNNVVLKSKDQELMRVFPMWLHWQAMRSKDHSKYIRATGLDMFKAGFAGKTGSRDCILPLGLMPWAKTSKDSLDLKFLENMYLDLSVRKASGAGGPCTGFTASTITDIDAHLKYHNLSNEDYSTFLSNNYSQSKSLSKMMVSNYQENIKNVTGAVAGAKTETIPLYCPNYAVASYIGIRPTEGGGLDREAGGATAYLPVSNCVVRGNGKNLYTTNGNARAHTLGLASKHGTEEQYNSGANNFVAGNGVWEETMGPGNIFKIDWRLLNNPSLVDNDKLEGGVSFGAVSSKEAEISFTLPADVTGYQVEILHEVVQLVNINAKNGSVSVSTRS